MPLKGGRFTPQERAFVEHMARTGDSAYAAHKAGYAQPSVRGPQMLSKPAIVENVQAQIVERTARTAFHGIGLLEDTILDEKQPRALRINAATTALKLNQRMDQAAPAKDPWEMTPAESAKRLAELEAEQAALKLVEQERNRPLIEGEAIEHSPDTGGLFD